MQRYGQKHPKYPQNGCFPHFVTSKIFFQKSGSVTLYPYGALKTNGWYLRYLDRQADQLMDQQTDRGPLHTTPSDEPGSKKGWKRICMKSVK